MDNEQEYITITQIAKDLGWNKATVYDWINTLGMEKHRFLRNKNTYLHISDVKRLKEIKAKPWTAGPNTARTARSSTEKVEKQPVLPSLPRTPKPLPDGPKRVYNRKQDTGLPDGYVLATEFALNHSIKRETFRDHQNIGLGPGLIHGPDVDETTQPVKDYVHSEERNKRVRKDGTVEKERYLTADQQKAALEFWHHHNVSFAECNDIGCWCHTLKNRV